MKNKGKTELRIGLIALGLSTERVKILLKDIIQVPPYYSSTKKSNCWVRASSEGDYASYWTITIKGKVNQAHRLVYQILNGPIGDMFVCHHCDRPACINPEHLFLGTHADNMRDAYHKGRKISPIHYQTEPRFSVQISKKYRKLKELDRIKKLVRFVGE